MDDFEFQPANLHGLGWNTLHESPCLILKAGCPEAELVFDVNSLEAGDLIHYLDHPLPGLSSHDMIIKLFIKNNYLIEGLYITSQYSPEPKCELRILRDKTRESWPLNLADGIALSLRMSFPLYVHRNLIPLTLNSPVNRVLPDVLC